MDIKLYINNDKLTCRNFFSVNTGNVETYRCVFDIKTTLSGLTWFCVFKQGEKVHLRAIKDNSCTVPEITDSNEPLFIGCYATNSDEAEYKRLSTNWLNANLKSGAYSEAATPEVPLPGVWETLIAKTVPIIGENGNWYIYDLAAGDYVDSGKSSRGTGGGGSIPDDFIDEIKNNYAKKTEVAADILSHNTDTESHNDIRISITELAKRLNALADSEDIELDQLSEIVAYIKSNKGLIDSITTSKVNVVDIIDNLTTNVSNKPLSAKQGLELKKLIDALDEYVKNTYPNLQGGITNAWNIAKEAITKAETAQETAEGAETKADNAQAKANSAYTLANGAGSVASGAKTTAEEALAKGNALEKNKQDNLSDEQINNINDIPNIKKDYAKTEDVNGKVAEHNTSDESHNDIRLLVQGLTDRLNAIANSEDVDLDQLSEVVAYIKNNKNIIDGITTSKVNVADIVDNLTTSVSNKPLSAKQGVILKNLINGIVVPTLLSELGQDATHRLVTDAEKQAWNNKSDFGGKFSDLTNRPTTLEGYGITDGATKTDLDNLSDEVDGKQPKGNYALKSELPTKTSQLDNDSNFLTEHQDLSDYTKETEVEEKLSTHNASDKSHSDIRILVQGLTDRLNALANSDDTTLDQLSEIVDYIKKNKNLIDGITTSKVSVSDIVDNLTSSVSNKPLSAKQGVALKALIDAIVVPTKVSQLENDSKFLTSVPSEYVTETELSAKGYLTQHQSLNGYAKTANHYTKTESDGKYQPKGNYLTIDTLPKYNGGVS